tara:strand:+ start:540 stop:737 length:198 start_codon:yes stop_codon:yes gene_type:complete
VKPMLVRKRWPVKDAETMANGVLTPELFKILIVIKQGAESEARGGKGAKMPYAIDGITVGHHKRL